MVEGVHFDERAAAGCTRSDLRLNWFWQGYAGAKRPVLPRQGGGEGQAVGRGVRFGLVTLPALMHDVHTWRRRGAPFTSARTRWMLGFHRRLVRRWEWLTLIPKEGCLPHTSHTAAMTRTPDNCQ